ncbi:sulfotransferase [Aquisalimonas lutea]|uniref:sulfotransferase n=1 Tax=Aquisalimonas lutea TaxID=1327750 RepID=UPI0025B4F39A|nr:sulfotransferase [Aquisalimonas lutea]MDN3517868.1 sulfotransferase [Aquisalimonas lutea]
MTQSVVIHIGLHKTGTRYLQRMVFAQLPSAEFVFNPPALTDPLRQALRAPGNREAADRAREAVERWRSEGDTRTLVLSQPHASGDMYGMHQGYEEHAALLRELFPKARIVYVVRNVASWLQSAYRQSLVKDPGQPIERFLNFYDGAFHPRPAAWVAGNRTLDATGMRFLDIYNTYAQAFGPERVYLFTQEHLRKRPDAVNRRLAQALAIDRLPEPPHERSQNRSFSALAIHLFFPGAWLRSGRPPEHAIGQGPGTIRRRLKRLRKLRANVIKHVFDRIAYIDWDLLERGGMRRELNTLYEAEEAELQRIASRILDEGPESMRQHSRDS